MRSLTLCYQLEQYRGEIQCEHSTIPTSSPLCDRDPVPRFRVCALGGHADYLCAEGMAAKADRRWLSQPDGFGLVTTGCYTGGGGRETVRRD
jgi:hypothetical protein